MKRVAVSTALLRWALERSGRDPAALSKKLPSLPQWLEGQSQPTLRQLETFATATSTPLGYLFLKQPPEERLPIPHFRTVRDRHPKRPSPDLLDTVQAMQRRQAWMREYLIDQGHEPLAFVNSAILQNDSRILAQKIRNTLGLEQRWAAQETTWTGALRKLQGRIEAAFILVVVNGIVGNNTHRRLDPEEFRGFVLVDDYAPLVFVNGADSKAAQMFTLAHELAHLWFGSSAAFDLRELQPADDDTERACNLVAAELLVPETELRDAWNEARRAPNRYQALARHFKVSELVAARRLLDLALIRTSEFHDFYQTYLQVERRAAKAPSGGDFYANQNFRIGRRFGELVIRATREGKLLYRDAYQLTGLHGRSFEHYAESLTFGAAG
jgi:Zn-dependent peptidase ImmA (M78 family)